MIMKLLLPVPIRLLSLLAVPLLLAALACGPAAPADQGGGITRPLTRDVVQHRAAPDQSRGITPPAAQENAATPTPTPDSFILIPSPHRATLIASMPTPTPVPTMTPLPPGYIKPTDPPITPPFDTLPPPPPESAASRGAEPTPEPTPEPPLTQQVTQFAREQADLYDVVARVRALSHRTVTTPMGIEWPEGDNPNVGLDGSYVPWLRTRIQVIETFHGRLPEYYEVVTWTLIPNASLEINREYILFLAQVFVGEDEFPGGLGRYHFNEELLKAVGGKGGFLRGEHLWVIEGGAAWWVPIEHIQDHTPESNLAAAKAGGRSLPVADLVAAIRAGIE